MKNPDYLQVQHARMGKLLRDIILASGVELPDDISDELAPGPDLVALGEDVVRLLKNQASAATEQEPVVWANGERLKSCAEDPFNESGDPKNISGCAKKTNYCDTPLYTHADPSEVAQLRAELAKAQRNEHNSEVAYRAAIERQDELRADRDAATKRADAADRKLGEAVEVLRDIAHAYRTTTCSVYKILPRADALISASAEPAKSGNL